MEALEPRRLLANVVVSEFAASNDTLLDYDDDTSDWIELENRDTVAVDVGGWYLTDSADDLDRWAIPASTVLAPQDRLLVFASGKDFVAPTGEMHTNFQLNRDGEYLALVEPDGTIAWEIDPAYPPQRTGLTYGIAQTVETTVLLDPFSTGRVLVPTDAAAAGDWTAPDYDDANWGEASGGVGYAVQGPEQLTGGFQARMIDVDGGTDGTLNNAAEAKSIFDGDFPAGNYNLSLDLTTTIPIRTVNMGGGAGEFGNTQPYPDGTAGSEREDFAVMVTSTLHIPQGDWTIAFGSDDGGYLTLDDINFRFENGTNGDSQLNDNTIEFQGTRGHGWTRGSFTVDQAEGLTTRLEAMFFERGGGDSFEIAVFRGLTGAVPDANNWTLLEHGALGWSVQSLGIPAIPVYQPLIDTDLADQMYDRQPPTSSAYYRLEFDVEDPSVYDAMTLSLQYDDAFVAYLNGAEVTRANFTGDPTWDSVADATRFDLAASTPENFNLSGSLDLLAPGRNVLAIHGINEAADATGFLLRPLLQVQQFRDTRLAYMEQPTPGAQNTVGATAYLGEPELSRTSGVFAEPFDLTISTAEPDTIIRYTTDGSLPTAGSPIYTEPIPVSQTTQVRVRSYAADKIPSEIVTETFVELGADLGDFSSDIPVMVVETLSQGIGQNEQTVSYMSLLEPGVEDGRTRLTDSPTRDARAGIQVRGSSSAGAAKQNFSLELWKDDSQDGRNLSLLGMPSESDWVLHAPDWFDRSLINNALAFELSNQIGRYATRTRFVELFLNRDGGDLTNADYAGVYVLTEKIKRDENRVDIEEVASQYTTEPEITGGYIFKFDRADPGDAGLNFTTLDGTQALNLKFVEPKEEEMLLRPAQYDYVEQYMTDVSSVLASSSFRHPVSRLSFEEYIDVGSWVDHHIINEVMLNVDALRLSAYLFKSREGLLEAGPQWDFDRAEESNDGRDDNPRTWYMDIETVPWWWDRVFQNTEFRQAWIDRWQQLRENELSLDNIYATMDEMAEQLTEASGRNTVRWGGTYPPRSGATYNSGMLNGTFLGEIEHKKVWLRERLEHFDSLFVQRPEFSHEGGVISEPIQVTLTTPTDGARIYYTVDGSDPRRPRGSLSPLAIEYTGPITVDGTTVITARSVRPGWEAAITDFAPGPELWSGPHVNAYTMDSPPPLRISELNYNPAGPTEEELSINPQFDNDDFEFVELRNVGEQAFNLINTRFVNGIDFTFAARTIEAGERVLVVKNRAAFEARYGQSAAIVGEFTGSLNNGGENVELVDAIGAVIHDFSYSDTGDWPRRANGLGSSLQVVDTEGNYDNPFNWRDSSEYLGTPGGEGAAYGLDVVVNEVLSHTDPPQTDSVELHNRSAHPIDIGGWYLSDSTTEYLKYRIAEDVVIAAGGYVVFDESHFNPSMGVDPDDFAFSSAAGDAVVLTEVDENGNVIRWVDQVTFGAQANGESWARFPNATGPLYPASQVTLGEANGPPRVGPVVISEIMYNPPDPASGTDPDDLEYVELYNPTDAEVVLTDWRIRGGIDFDFAQEQSIPAKGLLVVTSFDPVLPENADLLNEFRSHYGIDENVALVGGYSGRLDNGGERVTLERPDSPPPDDPTFIPRLVEDESRFEDDAPWPTSPDGTGASLARVIPATLGSDPTSWYGAAPTPGTLLDSPQIAGVGTNQGFADPPDLAVGPQPSSWATQRSEVRNIVVTFSEPVTIGVDDIVLTNLGIDAPVDPDVQIALDAAQLEVVSNTLTIRFDPDALSDGVYELTILPTVVDSSGNALDGDADGVAGGEFRMTGNSQNGLFLLTSDFNGDAGASIFDFQTIAYWFGRADGPQYADLNRDLGVSIFDFNIFARRFGETLRFPEGLTSDAATGLPGAAIDSDSRSDSRPADAEAPIQQVARRVDLSPLPARFDRPDLGSAADESTDEAALGTLEDVLNEISADVSRSWTSPR